MATEIDEYEVLYDWDGEVSLFNKNNQIYS